MQPLFEIKNRLPLDPSVLEHMRKTAVDLLHGVERAPHTQVIVLYSSKGNEYGAVLRDALSKAGTEETSLLEGAATAEDTEIQCVLCMWQDHGIDIPSMSFRRMLCDLNSKNADAVLVVMTADGIGGIRLSATMK